MPYICFRGLIDHVSFFSDLAKFDVNDIVFGCGRLQYVTHTLTGLKVKHHEASHLVKTAA